MTSLNRRYIRPAATAASFATAPDLYRLTFLLPRELTLGLGTGLHHPCLHQCLLFVEHHRERDYCIRIQGPSRELVFDQARRYLRTAARGHLERGAAFQIAAVLVTPHKPAGRDRWTIIVGADVAFSPTGLGADLPAHNPVNFAPAPVSLRGGLA
jgi:hypothetical protein